LTIPGRYSSEVDVDFVRKSIKAIGQTAISIESAAERCVNVLLELINTRVSYVVQEGVVVMKVRDDIQFLEAFIIIRRLGYLQEVPLHIRRSNPHTLRKFGRVG
jgi:hypothetical protein